MYNHGINHQVMAVMGVLFVFLLTKNCRKSLPNVDILGPSLGQRTPEPDGHPSRDPGGGPRMFH